MFGNKKKRTLEQLLEGCQQDKSWAQKELYERYTGIMLGICFRYIKDRQEAESVMVQGFVKIFEKVHQFQSSGSFEGWMKRIMVNESLQYLRQNKYMYVEVELEHAAYEPDFGTLDAKLAAEDICMMIADLPVGYRTVFNMYAIEGYSHKEIAEKLGINENTSKSQLSRARNILQNKLRKKQEEEEKVRNSL